MNERKYLKGKLTSSAKGDIPRDSDMIKLQQVRDGAKPGEESRDILEVILSKFYKRSGGKHSLKIRNINNKNK